MYTEFIETGSLSAYARICQLRLDPHAQKEIRDYAGLVASLMATAFPVSWEALMSPSAPIVAPTSNTIEPPGTSVLQSADPNNFTLLRSATAPHDPSSIRAAPQTSNDQGAILEEAHKKQAEYTMWGC